MWAVWSWERGGRGHDGAGGDKGGGITGLRGVVAWKDEPSAVSK